MYTQVLALTLLSLCLAEEPSSKRQTRNPGLLHLVHAGQSVGAYVTAGPARQASTGVEHGGVGGGGGGGGGPHIVILGGHPAHVSTRVAGRDSLEELEEDLRQHYGRVQVPGVRYVPNSSFQGHFPSLGFSGAKDSPGLQYSGVGAGHDYPSNALANGHSSAFGFGLNKENPHITNVGFRVTPLIYNNHGARQPVQAYTQATSTYVAHPVSSFHGGPSTAPQYNHAATPTPGSYASPTPYSATPSPVTHTIATPVIAHTVVPARIPIYHPLQGRVSPGLHNVRYHPPLTHAPVFVPVQAVPHQPQAYSHRFGLGHQQNAEYTPYRPDVEGRSQSHYEGPNSGEDERQRYYENQERRPAEHYQTESYQRDFDSNSEEGAAEYPQEHSEYKKSFEKYEGEESLAKSASYPSEDKGSFEDSSNEAGSEEGRGTSGTFQYRFADDHTTGGRSYNGLGKVATSYQSVTLETQESAPRYFSQKHL